MKIKSIKDPIEKIGFITPRVFKTASKLKHRDGGRFTAPLSRAIRRPVKNI